MALARIFSRYPQEAAALCLELQQKGYTVEVLTPEQTPATPANLEIQLEACEPADVLRRAEELASQLYADIAIAPGALPPPAEEPVSAAPAAAAPELAPPKILLVMRETEAGNSEPAPAVSATSTPTLTLTEDAQAARASGSALAALAATAGKFLSSARAGFHERLEEARIIAAEAGARRQERLLELARRRAEARQRALTLESSRRALAAYLLQLQRQYPDLLPGAQSDAGAQPASVVGSPAPPSPTQTRRLHMTKWEALLALAASATAMFVAGLAVASFHSRPANPIAKPGVTSQSGGGMQASQPKPASPQRPSPAARKTTPQRPAQAPSRARQPKPEPGDRELVARDVVVRHFPVARPTPTPQTTGWKHFSDLSH